MFTFRALVRATLVLMLTILLHAPGPATAAVWSETDVVATPLLSPPDPIAPRADGSAVGASRLDVSVGATWETTVDVGSLSLRVDSGVLTVALDAGAAVLHVASQPLSKAPTLLVGAEEAVKVQAGDWLSAGAGAALIAHNEGPEDVTATLYWQIPFPPIAPNRISSPIGLSISTTDHDGCWVAVPLDEAAFDRCRARPAPIDLALV